MRFVCGAIAGLFAGYELAGWLHSGKVVTVLWMLLTGAAFGAAAALLGDRFWLGPRIPRDL